MLVINIIEFGILQENRISSYKLYSPVVLLDGEMERSSVCAAA